MSFARRLTYRQRQKREGKAKKVALNSAFLTLRGTFFRCPTIPPQSKRWLLTSSTQLFTSSCQGMFAMVMLDALESPQYVTPWGGGGGGGGAVKSKRKSTGRKKEDEEGWKQAHSRTSTLNYLYFYEVWVSPLHQVSITLQFLCIPLLHQGQPVHCPLTL